MCCEPRNSAVSTFTDYIKGLSSSTLDVELRMLQIIEDDDDGDDDDQEPITRPELHSIELLLDYFIHELSCRNNFEFLQAVIRLFLKVPKISAGPLFIKNIILLAI